MSLCTMPRRLEPGQDGLHSGQGPGRGNVQIKDAAVGHSGALDPGPEQVGRVGVRAEFFPAAGLVQGVQAGTG